MFEHQVTVAGSDWEDLDQRVKAARYWIAENVASATFVHQRYAGWLRVQCCIEVLTYRCESEHDKGMLAAFAAIVGPN